MRRFFVNSGDLVLGQAVNLEGDEFHHLKNVSRLEAGEWVELLDGVGHIARATIKEIKKSNAILLVEEIKDVEPQAEPKVKIILSLPRFQKMDLIIQKCAELGASEIIPVVSDRSFVKSITADLERKQDRWQKISLEACKQSGRAWPLLISPVRRLEQQVAVADSSSSLFLYEGEGVLGIKDALKKFQNPKLITVFVGSEGGYSPKEESQFRERGMHPVTLGSLVLRVETACIAILSVIQFHFDHMR